MEDLKALHQLIQQGKGNESSFEVHDGLMRSKRCIYISKHSTLKALLLGNSTSRIQGGCKSGSHASPH
jgi:hypothetical protein